MSSLVLHEFHQTLGAAFAEVNGCEMVAGYGDIAAEHAALATTAGVLDFSARSRLCLVGADRARFLHGQVTNGVKNLDVGQGCYAALVSAKGRLESDLNIFCLAEELLLDFEPGMTAAVTQRLEKFLVADDVQIVDAAPHYGLLSVQGPKAVEVVAALGVCAVDALPAARGIVRISDAMLSDIYLTNLPRLGMVGFDLFVPTAALGAAADKLIAAARQVGGRACGWEAFEISRIETGIPRFGVDMDENVLPQECGLGETAVSYQKGCYIGQEVLNRIHSFGHVNRELRGFILEEGVLPAKGGKILHQGKEAGHLTSVTRSLKFGRNLAMGYLRREANQAGAELFVQSHAGLNPIKTVSLPFAL